MPWSQLALELPKCDAVTDLDYEKKTPICDRSMSVLHPKGNKATESAGHRSEAEPIGKAQT